MKNKSRFHESSKNPHRLNAVLLRGIIISACLISVGTGLVLLSGRNSRAALLPQQEGKASPDGVWQDVAKGSITRTADETQSEKVLKEYRAVRLEKSALMNLLAHAPMEFTAAAKTNPVELTLPLPDGKFGRFQVVESPMLEPDFAAEFPEIKTYSGRGIDDTTATTRLDLTIRGFHAIILSSAGTIFVAPGVEKLTPNGSALPNLGEATEYISYFQRHDPREGKTQCDVQGALSEANAKDPELEPNATESTNCAERTAAHLSPRRRGNCRVHRPERRRSGACEGGDRHLDQWRQRHLQRRSQRAADAD